MLRSLLGVLGLALSLGLASYTSAGCAPPMPEEEMEETNAALQDGVVGNLSGKSVLILPFAYPSKGETECFRKNGESLLAWYVTQGAAKATSKVVPIGTTAETFFAVLEAEKAAGAKYDRVITMGHGGLDGPIFSESGQVGLDWPQSVTYTGGSSSSSSGAIDEDAGADGPTAAEIDAVMTANRAKVIEMGALLRAITTPKSFVYLGSCNAGTGKSAIDPAFSFVELTSCVSGRAAFGTATLTSCTDAGNRIKRLEKADVSNMLKEGDPSNLPASAVGITCR